jgi:cytochrome c-type biogenesis protein CcmH/NrfG
MLTKSRSAYIASGVGLLLVWQLSRTAIPIPAAVKRKRSILWIIAGVMASVLLAVALLGGPGGVLLAKATKSFGYRVQYWQSSLHMIADHPIVGCGPGNFQNVYSQYKLPEAAEEVADPHNFLLEIAATAGLPAALAFLAVLGCFARSVVSGQWSVASGRWSVASKSEISNLKSEISNFKSQISGSPNPQSLIPNPSSSALLFSGAIFGFLLSVPVGMLSAAPQSFVVLLLGLPLAIVAMLLLRGWVRDGRLPTWLPVVGVVVVLIDLSTTGGIAYPSIAGSFWLLLVLGLQNDRPHTLRPIAARILFVAFLALAGMCYFTAYSPVLSCQAQLRLAEREPVPSVEHLEAAAAADPWSAEPWRQLAAVEFERWRQQPNPKTFERFELAIGRSIELAPNSATAWLTAGDFYVQAFSRVEQTDPKMAAFFLNRARSAYGEAVRLYPNNATFRAKLADAYRAEGDISGFRREAKAALRLDNLTPHIDKKLPADTRKRLVQDLDGKL